MSKNLEIIGISVRRASQQRSAGLPPAGPMRPPVPDLTEVHGPLYPTERRHEFPRDPPPRVESKTKDDFKFPVMVEDGKHSCTEVSSQIIAYEGESQNELIEKIPGQVPKAGEKVSTLTVSFPLSYLHGIVYNAEGHNASISKQVFNFAQFWSRLEDLTLPAVGF